MGLPLDAMGSLALIMLTAQAATLLIVPSLVTNVWQFTRGATAVRISCRLAIGNFLNALHHSDCSSPARFSQRPQMASCRGYRRTYVRLMHDNV